MARSKREIPHYYLASDLDLGPGLDWLRRHNREIPVARRVLPAALLLRAVAGTGDLRVKSAGRSDGQQGERHRKAAASRSRTARTPALRSTR
jgi:hypothetical protein